MSTSPYPVRLVGGHELERSRLTVFFRIILLIPHAIVLSAVRRSRRSSWSSSPGSRRSSPGACPTGMHNFIAGYLRYYARVVAYGTILADPFPPFGSGGTYPVDLEIDPPVAQGRLTVFFRGLILVIPCWILVGLRAAAVCSSSSRSAAGSSPCSRAACRTGCRTPGMFCLRFISRTHAYFCSSTRAIRRSATRPGRCRPISRRSADPVAARRRPADAPVRGTCSRAHFRSTLAP